MFTCICTWTCSGGVVPLQVDVMFTCSSMLSTCILNVYMYDADPIRQTWELENEGWKSGYKLHYVITCSPQNILFPSVRNGFPASLLPTGN